MYNYYSLLMGDTVLDHCPIESKGSGRVNKMFAHNNTLRDEGCNAEV